MSFWSSQTLKSHLPSLIEPFNADPGYSGKLIFAVYNAGPLNFHVARGERVFSIWYADLDKDDENPRNKIGYDSIPTDLMIACY
ncbi:hypothetical protein AB0758_44625 [Tolypothrix bouteillei VB521301_2]|uniref:hypothetical protein n=1 Tax=Tolypothrix bouteillei TaxID=1246981 RepID=UPI0005139D34